MVISKTTVNIHRQILVRLQLFISLGDMPRSRISEPSCSILFLEKTRIPKASVGLKNVNYTKIDVLYNILYTFLILKMFLKNKNFLIKLLQ